MNPKTLRGWLEKSALALAALAVAAAPSFAQSVALVALESMATMPDGTTIRMWGFAPDTGQSCTPATLPAWEVGPVLSAAPGAALTVDLRNCLPAPVSIIIPGQAAVMTPVWDDGSTGARLSLSARVRSFTHEAAAFNGVTAATASYSWSSLGAGTYLYHSATRPQVQVQMGLYGALTVGNYGITREATLVYSEIDPALHAAVAGGTYGTAAFPSTIGYRPRYFLINGKSYPDTTDLTINTSEDVLLRFVNAGLKTHVPTLRGLYMEVLAEDGKLYPFPREQYGVELAAAKTVDALINVGSPGRYALYDRALALTNAAATGGGMLTYLQVGAVPGAPTAVDDDYTVAEDGILVALAGDLTFPGVLDNDLAGTGPGPLTALLVVGPSAGVVECVGGDHPAVCADGSFTYTPPADFNGTDVVTYVANDGGPDSNVATVRITVTPVNDPPVAVADAWAAVEGETLSVAGPGVLANDSDPDGDFPLTAVQVGTSPPGTLVLHSDGSFDYTPAGVAGAVESFDYAAHDGTVASAAATVTITVVAPPANVAPFANDDYGQTSKNTPLLNFNVVANDVDVDGTIVATTVVITSGATTSRGGTVVDNGDGTVTYTPKQGFRGTDTFTYTVDDDDGATSNQATVRINVL